MHRLGRHRKGLISYGARFNSTVAGVSPTTATTLPRNRRNGITLRWGTVEIPSREEILKIPKAELYSPDLSYLQKAPQNSLAGRLAKPKFQPKDVSAITEKRRLQRLTREEKTAQLSTPGSTSESKTHEIEPPDIAAITQKRIEMRLAREAKQAYSLNETVRTVQDNADRLTSVGPLFDSPGPLPLAQPAGYQSAKRLDDELSPLALKRREERRLREARSSRDRQSSSRRNRERSGPIESDGVKLETVRQGSHTTTELEAASATVHAPEFNGPESISETIDLFSNSLGVVQPARRPSEHGQHSVKVSQSPSYRLNPSMIDSFAGGDYSRYISSSLASSSISPNAVTAVKTAELALSYQRDYAIPQRKHAIEIVKTVVGANLAQIAKERQTAA